MTGPCRIGHKLEQPGGRRRVHHRIANLCEPHEIDETGVLARTVGIVTYGAGGILQYDMCVVRETPETLEQRSPIVTAVAQRVA